MAGLSSFLGQKINGFSKRIRAGAYGIYYRRDSGYQVPEKLKINGRTLDFRFFERTVDRFTYEFNQICLYDCYRLKQLGRDAAPVKVIVDIGANQGLFLIAARQHFPSAVITGYEPNEELRKFLEPNAKALGSTVYFEAVSVANGKVLLDPGASDLHTRTIRSEEGNVSAVSLRNVVARAGGTVDILKLDCEGAEWELFEDHEPWQHIRSLTMEYHLWAKPGASFDSVRRILDALGFSVIHHDALDSSFGLLTALRNNP